MSMKNKIILSFFVLILVSIVSSVIISINLKSVDTDTNNLTEKYFAGIAVLLEADRDSYQSNLALSQIMNLENKESIDKTINKGVNDNLLQIGQRFDKFKVYLKEGLSSNKKEFDDFDKYYNLTKNHTEILVKLVKEGKQQEAKAFYFDTYLKDYESMRDIIDFFSDETYKFVDKNKNDVQSLISSSLNIFVIITILIIILTLFFSYSISKNFNKSINNLQNGLLEFFKFLNKETKNTSLLDTTSKDEIAFISEIINKNILKTQKLIEQDNQLIDEVKNVVTKVKNGKLDIKILNHTDNESLEELKNNFNEMLEVIGSKVCMDINKLTTILNDYSKLDFRNKVENDNGEIAIGVNNLAQIITEMLIENKSNGLTLDDSSKILLSNVNKLNVSSNEAAARLEETAAALEEITSNIRNNTENIAKMSNLSGDVTKSATNGEKLANQTTVAMDEINNQVNLITDAIFVIDQIAFQTNILSLNAAVEAATTGEAGKGFAVVAAEVRNLAARSAEAAKEIKTIVENAKHKADEGKDIAGNMIAGYKELNESIQQTINLISDIEMSSKEQLSGIEQINDAVNSLDQQTQQNAAITSETHNAAGITDEIAKLVLDDANKKEFKGKNEVEAKNMNIKSNSSYEVKVNHTVAKKVETQVKHTEPKVVSTKHEEDEWESF